MFMKLIEKEWNELCPIFYEHKKKFEQIGTGVLIELEKNIYLLTAAHVVDEIYNNENANLLLPSVNGFDIIEGELFHNPLTWNQKREDDKIDFSYYKLSPEMIEKLYKTFKPLSENKIDFNAEYSDIKNDSSIKPIHHKEVIKRLKKMYKDDNYDEIAFKENYQIEKTITFAGYPSTKSKEKDNQYSSEIVYYHGRKVDNSVYESIEYHASANIIARYGSKAVMNSKSELINSPKPQGISGGGVYRLVKINEGIDRRLIGIGHSYKSKQHLFIGTNIKHCIDVITNKRLMPYEVYKRLNIMTDAFNKMDIVQ